LNGTTCVANCPDGFYDDGTLVCKKCPAECLTCTGPKIAPSATYQPQAISRISSKVGAIALAQTLIIQTHPSSVLSATVIARPVKTQQPIA
jgi:hypothetical protein